MITTSDFVQQLKLWFPAVKFYNGAINKAELQCVGVYARGRGVPYKAIGGAQNTSYSVLPVTILVHWTENANTCETMANSVYEQLFNAEDVTVGGKRVISFTMLDSAPVDVLRDERNIVEMVIRLNIVYER